MVRRPYCTSGKEYRPAVLEAMKKFVEPGVFQSPEGVSRLWTPWRLVLAAVLMAWEGAGSLAQRFATTRITLRQWWPKQSLGRTYQGWIKALVRLSPRLLETLTAHLRQQLQAVAGPFWRRQGQVAFAVDGSRLECPRTAANEAALGCAGRQKTGPQLFVTSVYHMGTGLLWAFRCGPGTDSERTHLRQMLGLWLLSLLSVSQILARGRDPLGLSVALAVRQVRLALRQNRLLGGRGLAAETSGRGLEGSLPAQGGQAGPRLAAQEERAAARRAEHPGRDTRASEASTRTWS